MNSKIYINKAFSFVFACLDFNGVVT